VTGAIGPGLSGIGGSNDKGTAAALFPTARRRVYASDGVEDGSWAGGPEGAAAMRKDTTSYGADRPAWDKNDCSVRALAVATGVPYAVASVAYSVLGRRVRAGTEVSLSERLHIEILGMVQITAVEGMDLETFLQVAPKGRYVVHKVGHAFAVVDGVVHDWENTTRPATRITRVWKVTERARAKMEGLKGLI
jgi:hypothetical protein